LEIEDPRVLSAIAIPSVTAMKGLPALCCQCHCPIIDNSTLMRCQCLIVVCQECARLSLKDQIRCSDRQLTYCEWYLRCPVCSTTTDNKNDALVRNMDHIHSRFKTLLFSAALHYEVKLPNSDSEADWLSIVAGKPIKFSTREVNNSLQEVLDGFLNDGILTQWSGYRMTNARRHETILLLARLESYRQQQQKGNVDLQPVTVRDLPLGPLEEVQFRRNSTLERILASIESDSEEIAVLCDICKGPLVDRTVQSFCSCVYFCCQSCIVKTATNRVEFLSMSSPDCLLLCPHCKQLSIPYTQESHRRAYEYQTQLLESLYSRNGSSLSVPNSTAKIMSRMELKRQLRRDQGVCSSVPPLTCRWDP